MQVSGPADGFVVYPPKPPEIEYVTGWQDPAEQLDPVPKDRPLTAGAGAPEVSVSVSAGIIVRVALAGDVVAFGVLALPLSVALTVRVEPLALLIAFVKQA